MAEKKLFFTVGADVTPGTREFDRLAKAARKSMGEVDDAVDDTRTNAERVADALDAVFDEIDSSMKETEDTARTLARAMGPELADKVSAVEAVQEFQRLGLTLEEIRLDADRLADTLRRADDVSLRGFGGEVDTAKARVRELGDEVNITGRRTDDLGKSADSSKSVMANMVGNSTQDLAEFGGIAGSAGVALGQMGEYMVDASNDGDKLGTVMSNFGKVAGPIAALTIAVSAVGSIFKASGDRAKRATEQVEAFSGALEDVESATSAVEGLSGQMRHFDADARTAWGGFVEGVAGAAKAIPLVGGLIGDAGQNVADVIPTFVKLGITADDIGEAAVRGGGAWDSLQSKLYAAQVGAHITSAEYSAASQVLYGFRDSAEEAAEVNEFLAGSQEEATKEAVRGIGEYIRLNSIVDALSSTSDGTKGAIDRLRGAHRGAADMARQQEERLRSLREEMLAATGQAFDLEQATIELDGAYAAYGEQMWANLKTQQDAEASDYEKAESARQLRLAELSVAEQAYATAGSYADQAIKMGDARSKSDIMKDALGQQAAKYPELRDEIQTYIDKLNEIPRSINTRITTTGASGAAAARIAAGAPDDIRGRQASGGPVMGGGAYLVGERGPEIIIPRTSGDVIPNDKLGSGGTVYNYTIQADSNSVGDLMDALRRMEFRREAMPVAGARR